MEKDRLSRKLAVILHADVVGSTSLVQMNETLAHERIQAVFHRFSETVTAYGGRTHELRGDALVAEFGRASDAVSAALVFQAHNEESNATDEHDIHPRLRIGISLGEVVIADNTVTGAGVVLAQRLEQLAGPGGVVVQGTVSETVPTRMPFEFESLGEQALKGFDQPVRACSVTLRPGETLPAPEAGAAPQALNPDEREYSDKASIAVLPFANMSNDPEQEYFADGITEDIITELSKISGLTTISRNSTFTYKGKAAKAQDVCRDLGVRYMMEGSVRKAGERLRITAQLIDGVSGGHLWAERYDRELADIFAVQDDVTGKIVGALEVNLITGTHDRPPRVETKITEAYDCVLRGREQYRLFSREGNLNAARLYQKAIELDPDYAAAYAGLAMTCLHEWFQGSPDLLEKAFELAIKASVLDPSLPLVYEALGNVQLFRKQHEESVSAARGWIEVEPGNADAYANLAGALLFCGEPERVIHLIEKAMRLNPYYPFYYVLYKGKAYLAMERYEDALVNLERSAALNPGALYTQIYLAACYGLLGDMARARAALAEVHRIFPDFSPDWIETFLPYKHRADRNRLIDGLRRAGLSAQLDTK